MSFFSIVFFLVSFLLLLRSDSQLFLYKKQTIFLTVLLFSNWMIYLRFPAPGLTIFLIYTFVGFYLIQRNFGNWLVPTVVFVKNYLFLITISLLFRDLPNYALGMSFYTQPFPQLSMLVLVLFSYILYQRLTTAVISKYHLKDMMFSLNKTYRGSSITILSFFVATLLLHEYFYLIDSNSELLLSILLIVFTGSGFLVFLLFFAKNAYLEWMINQLNDTLQVTEANATPLKEFKHDYKNILYVLNHYLDTKNYEEASAYLKELTDYSAELLDDNSYQTILSIPNLPLRASLLDIYQRVHAHTPVIDYHVFYCPFTFEVPMEMIDFVRCLSILLNNAFESVQNQSNGEIIVQLSANQSGCSLTVENSLTEEVQLQQILKKHYSTKSAHQGLGLHNLHKILQDYPMVDYTIEIDQQRFKAQLCFVTPVV